MADVVNEATPVAAPVPAKELEPLARRRPVATVSRHRFAFAYLMLAAIVGAAVGLIVVFSTGDNDKRHSLIAPKWSSWAPMTTGTLGVREIAQHVAPRYVLANRHQLAGVIAGPMTIPSASGPLPITAIVVSSGTAGVPQEQLSVDYPQAGALYQICGSDPTCSIPGTPTLARGQSVRREALELALYTFHYMPQADQVLVLLPPPNGAAVTDPSFHRAVFFPRAALAHLLKEPLKTSLPPESSKILPGSLSRAENRLVDGVTGPNTFHYDLQQSGDQGVLVLLSPLDS